MSLAQEMEMFSRFFNSSDAHHLTSRPRSGQPQNARSDLLETIKFVNKKDPASSNPTSTTESQGLRTEADASVPTRKGKRRSNAPSTPTPEMSERLLAGEALSVEESLMPKYGGCRRQPLKKRNSQKREPAMRRRHAGSATPVAARK